MNIAKLKKYLRRKKGMMNYDELEEMMANTDVKYFAFIVDNRDILTKLKGKIMNVSSFHYIGKFVKKVAVEEYTNTTLKKVEQNENVVIEQEVKTSEYKFIRTGMFNSIGQILSQAIDEASLYVFIDSGTTFDHACENMSSAGIPFIHVKYTRAGLNLGKKKFTSIACLTSYIMKNYYL